MPLAVAFSDVVLWVHILAFFIAFGPTYGYGMFMAAASKAGPQAMIEAVRVMMKWDRIAITIGGVVLLVTGHAMVEERGWEFSDFFVNWGNVAVLVLLGLTHAYFVPREKRVIAALEEGREDEAQAIGAQVGKMGAVAGVIVIVTIYVMTAKPFL